MAWRSWTSPPGACVQKMCGIHVSVRTEDGQQPVGARTSDRDRSDLWPLQSALWVTCLVAAATIMCKYMNVLLLLLLRGKRFSNIQRVHVLLYTRFKHTHPSSAPSSEGHASQKAQCFCAIPTLHALSSSAQWVTTLVWKERMLKIK